jgi:hypothetical protein
VVLGEDTIVWLVLALGAALVVGNALALVRPPAEAREGELAQAPRGRSVLMIVVGLACAIPAIAALSSR